MEAIELGKTNRAAGLILATLIANSAKRRSQMEKGKARSRRLGGVAGAAALTGAGALAYRAYRNRKDKKEEKKEMDDPSMDALMEFAEAKEKKRKHTGKIIAGTALVGGGALAASPAGRKYLKKKKHQAAQRFVDDWTQRMRTARARANPDVVHTYPKTFTQIMRKHMK